MPKQEVIEKEQEPVKEPYYDYISRTDVIGLMGPNAAQTFAIRDEDGKLKSNQAIGMDTPWHHVAHMPGAKCDIWHQVEFDMMGPQLPQKFVPVGCQNCWKVVVRPKTLKQLFQLEKIQEGMNKPSKCGIEPRTSVHGLYGGYFYNNSLEQGLTRYTQVRAAVDKVMGKDVVVLLKRGCTEFELALGDSKKWTVYDWQIPIEEATEDTLAQDNVDRQQPEHLVRHIHRKWIEWAYTYGDESYKEFTGGKPLYPAYRTYQHLAQATPDQIKQFWEDENA
tara:strand:+ start:9687 stop:10520 length:834 start_codon:yes stop_codon:yes gene_type:complete